MARRRDARRPRFVVTNHGPGLAEVAEVDGTFCEHGAVRASCCGIKEES